MSPESESVVLTLVMPVDVEDALLETLLDHPDLAPGFTSQAVEGHGQRVPPSSAPPSTLRGPRRLFAGADGRPGPRDTLLTILGSVLHQPGVLLDGPGLRQREARE